MLRNIVLVLALLALGSGMAAYSDNGVQSNHLVKATSTEPQVFGDTISIPTNEAAVPSCCGGTDEATVPGCGGSTDRPTIPSCCGST
jgi:hypothetical protein